jgi:microcystin-dependent protein
MSANITKKSDATGYLNQSINLSIDPYLTPTPTIPIKSGNLKQYLNRFIEWIFPGTPTDVRGKVLGVPHSDTANTDYSGLEWLTMMPLGGITMYAVNGINKDVGGGVYKAMINTVNPTNNNLSNFTKELDGFLFCQEGSTINLTIEENKKYKELQKLLNGYYGNNINSMLEITPGVYQKDLLYLPNMNGRVPLGGRYSSGSTDSFIENNEIKDVENYGKTGNVGGEKSHQLGIIEMPRHNHDAGTLVTQTIRGGNGLAVSGSDLTLNNAGQSYNLDIQGDTGYIGGNNTHENRQPYMVLSYIIKY